MIIDYLYIFLRSFLNCGIWCEVKKIYGEVNVGYGWCIG